MTELIPGLRKTASSFSVISGPEGMHMGDFTLAVVANDGLTQLHSSTLRQRMGEEEFAQLCKSVGAALDAAWEPSPVESFPEVPAEETGVAE
jgi:hypothetical protein